MISLVVQIYDVHSGKHEYRVYSAAMTGTAARSLRDITQQYELSIAEASDGRKGFLVMPRLGAPAPDTVWPPEGNP